MPILTRHTPLAALLFASLCAGAAAAPPSTTTASALVDRITHGQVIVDRTFAGPAENLTGIIGHVAASPAHKVLFWEVDGRYLLDGSLFDAAGTNLSRQAAVAQGVIPKPMPAAEVAALAAKAAGFTVGHAGPRIVAFEDPNCSACHLFMRAVAGDIQAGKLRVRVIPVGMVKPDSARRAAAILAAKHPAEAWRANEKDFDMQREEGGYAIGPTIPESALAQVESNTALLGRTGKMATPAILLCDGGKARFEYGYAPGMLRGIGSVNAAGGCGK